MITKTVKPEIVSVTDINNVNNVLLNKKGKLIKCFTDAEYRRLLQNNYVSKQFVLISLDDEIEIGDIGILYTLLGKKNGYSIGKYNKHNGLDMLDNQICPILPKKIVATQEQLSPEQIQQLIDEYNDKGMQDFEIEMERDEILHNAAKIELNSNYGNLSIEKTKEEIEKLYKAANHYKPKLTNGFVTVVNRLKMPKIHPDDLPQDIDESTLYTEEEVFDLGNKYEEYCISCFGNLPKSFSDWFSQNKK